MSLCRTRPRPVEGQLRPGPSPDRRLPPRPPRARDYLPGVFLVAAAFAGELRLTVLPNFGYTPDDGYGVGFYVDLHEAQPVGRPPRQVVVHTYLSSDGFQNQRLRFDLPGLGRLRLGGLFAWRAWEHDAYWGIGPDTVRDPAVDYEYGLVQPFGHLALAVAVGPGVDAYASADLRWTEVHAEPGSFLALDAPAGLDGGLAVQVGSGALYDSRDDVLTPRRGLLLEGGGRVVLTDPVFGGPFGQVRAFWGLGPCVIALRLMAEHLYGEVPFYEMSLWGGWQPIMGLGGYETLRGLPYGRFRGPGKALFNGELRIDLASTPLGQGRLGWQLVPLGDVAAVWAEDYDPWPLHPTAGLGLRGVWSGGLVGRIDAAVGSDPVLREGERTEALSWGFYLAFSPMF